MWFLLSRNVLHCAIPVENSSPIKPLLAPAQPRGGGSTGNNQTKEDGSVPFFSREECSL